MSISRAILMPALMLAMLVSLSGVEVTAVAAAKRTAPVAVAATPDAHSCCTNDANSQHREDHREDHKGNDCGDTCKGRCVMQCCRTVVTPADASPAEIGTIALIDQPALSTVLPHDLIQVDAIFHPPRA
jgi:hypothetical protein